ncbi:hypothetical protein HXX76_011580 [Chlamydomonas incerta]|uniref:Histone deacetylase complex subunit SAP18 n=1 Tax=Chlamydomonas incerta TaxID=51695 RepID=A0A835SMT1_CHLIN|nr:hypothetical protein HXX76_011580 [Chlamydomonas incerta]|eukprot:KAG2428461.1 hypothetical protein HXX76_011580 [Chlamydomonas incerta]
MYRGGQDWRDGPRGGPRYNDVPRGGPYGGPGPRGPPPAAAQPAAPAEEIDREKTCPLLMRVFPKQGGHHKLEDFTDRTKLPDEIAIYTWMDADLRELSDLIKEANPAARARNARMSFAFVYPDRKGRNVMRQVGVVHATRPGEDDIKTLRGLNFQTGDYLDVSIY